ncbi:hypothetical protein CPARA_1gp039 (nucleomorph) [Cryptomonas paramecium]|uniref:Uncharacterized protein n=1 Tax=Cryptomonas paramaecium TaxID=2898 RepID=F2HHA1_9CRYP|nr:hypothetical protein CPARA_1gp039 [Cryptomonas paramecium]AEA38697.1 hypothetical protein CPARA_1gp039 [Cryptomonas paramecium]
MFMNKLYKTKSFEKKLFPCNIYNWYFNQNIVQNLNEYIGFIYIFKFFDSKLSTVCIDGIFSMKKYHTNSFYLYKNLISTEHKTSCLILHIQFLELLNLYVKLSKNFRTNYNFNYFFKFNLNITLSRALVYCFFFISFFFVRIFKFALSHEIIFYSKKKFNLIKFLLDKNFQIDKQQKNVYFTNFVSFFSIKINRMCLNQLRSTYVKCKKSVYTYVYGYNSTLVFQKKFIERIAEKIWNLKLKFSESLFENFSKKFKKRSEIFSKKKQHNFFKYIKLVILLYIKINVLYKNSFLRKFRLMLFYSTYSFYFCVKLYFNFISWANTNVDLNEFKLFFSKKKTTGHRNCTKVLYQNLILKKYFKYEH